MNIVKVDATNSTNTLAREINREKQSENFCVSAEYQTEGRGQQDSAWNSIKSQNLTFTLVFNHLRLEARQQFILNALVCLNIYNVLKKYNIKNTFLKWPNDILAENKKICGILIENTLSANLINTSYVGVGINVNQKKFENLPYADSLCNIICSELDRSQLLQDLVDQLKLIPVELRKIQHNKIMNNYKSKLYKYKTESQFRLKNEIVSGVIEDINIEGRLKVNFGKNNIQMFQHKEISQLY